MHATHFSKPTNNWSKKRNWGEKEIVQLNLKEEREKTQHTHEIKQRTSANKKKRQITTKKGTLELLETHKLD